MLAPPNGGGYVIQADEAPPPLPDYDQPPMPAPGYYWTPGYWAWNNVDYYWVPGVWVEPPQPGLLWTPGYWAFVGGVYAFRPGYWGPRVGFYGGINYGFGYSGRGYEGGRWEGQRFFYNTAVNNIGVMRVTNVYNAPVVVNNVTTINRVSFNGGTGGVVAAPTPQQLSAASEPHIPPTPFQQNHVRAASVQPQQFLNTNQGKPAVAATPRPGAFNAKEAVPAKAAGSRQPSRSPYRTLSRRRRMSPPRASRSRRARSRPPPQQPLRSSRRRVRAGRCAAEAGAAPKPAPPPPPAPAPVAAPPKPSGAGAAPTPHPRRSPRRRSRLPAPPAPPRSPRRRSPSLRPGRRSPRRPRPPRTEARAGADRRAAEAAACATPPAPIVAPRPQPAPPPPVVQPRPQPPPPVAAPPPAAERRPPPPPGKQPPPCGRPGEPACPK